MSVLSILYRQYGTVSQLALLDRRRRAILVMLQRAAARMGQCLSAGRRSLSPVCGAVGTGEALLLPLILLLLYAPELTCVTGDVGGACSVVCHGLFGFPSVGHSGPSASVVPAPGGPGMSGISPSVPECGVVVALGNG